LASEDPRPGLAARLLGESGTAILETAFTLPLLLLVAVGIFEFGRAYQTWQVLTNAAREGARIAVLPNPASGAVEARVRAYMSSGQLPNVSGARINVNYNDTILIGSTTAKASKVTVNYDFRFMVLQPVANLIAGGRSLGGPLTMVAAAEMRNESQ
jgi:Flp pilus assembly protein TadG